MTHRLAINLLVLNSADCTIGSGVFYSLSVTGSFRNDLLMGLSGLTEVSDALRNDTD